MDRVARTVKRAGQNIHLAPTAFALLEYLMLNAGRPLTRVEIERHVWGRSRTRCPTGLPFYISYLREKLHIDFPRKLINAVRGVGYRLGELNERSKRPKATELGWAGPQARGSVWRMREKTRDIAPVSARILLVASRSGPLNALKKQIEAEGFNVSTATHSQQGRRIPGKLDYDLIILHLDRLTSAGFELLSRIRDQKTSSRVLVVVASRKAQDRIRCLNLGADDCIAKPLAVGELLAHVRALLRRSSAGRNLTLRIEDLEMDRVARTVKRAGRRIDLTPTMFALLEYLMLNAGRPLTRAEIERHVWSGSGRTMYPTGLSVYIEYLRRKLDAGFRQKLIHTIYGVGYRAG